MMSKKGVSAKKWDKRKQVYYGIPVDSHCSELLSRDLVKVVKLGYHLVAIHVRSDSATVSEEKASIRGDTESCKRYAYVKQVCLTGSFRKVIKRVAKHCLAMAVIAGTNPENAILGGISFTRFCQAITGNYCSSDCPQGKDYPWKGLGYELGGFKLESQPIFYLDGNHSSLTDEEAEVIEKTSSPAVPPSEGDASRDGSGGSKDGDFSLDHDYEEEVPLSSLSLLLREVPESTLGWPLLRITAPARREALSKYEVRDKSLVQRVNSLPDQSTSVILQNRIEFGPSTKRENSFDREIDNSMLQKRGTEGASSLAIQNLEDTSVEGSKNPKDENLGLVCEYKEEVFSSSISSSIKELPLSALGWPLLQIAASTTLMPLRESEARETSVVQWAISLPNRSTSVTPQTQFSLRSNTIENPVEGEISYSGDNSDKNFLPVSGMLTKELELLLKTKSSGCRWFSYEELKNATSQFSSENLIGEGGCSSVYKGYLPSGKPVAVKILKSYKEAWNDFASEIDIISSLKHKHITPLIGVCIGDDYLISVYDFLPKGSLEENLHGYKENRVLPWDTRFKVAVVVAEALDYLHNKCVRPIIHRDVKSSNILLSNEFQPQLSDFGLAIWGPTDSTYMEHGDVVGTFGYIAPEYFMHGRVSDKIDVYSFGVVLLELLSGKGPIGTQTLKGQESLVKWAKQLIDSGDLKALLDPKLNGDFDIVQMHRMVLVASLCINQSARLRPNASEILELLRGENDAEEMVKSHDNASKKSGNEEDDELYPEFGFKPCLDFALLDSDGDTASISATKPNKRCSLEDYLKGRHSLSSSH
ncbi:hypothetical protein L1049_026757 [Liquidambar formosana]|uniref:Protein kinase domain-containing protein n=1 Tax=Liquidambar formosana TaxID=63359 RepID=A0AAP0R8C6_LIQFO